MSSQDRYFKIPADKSDAIRADADAVGKANFELFSRLGGVPIRQITRQGNFAFEIARLSAIVSDVPPTEPGWKPVKDEPNRYAPDRRLKAGKALAEQLRGLDLLGILSALKRAGVSPFWTDFECGRGWHAGVDPTGPEILLNWGAEAGDPKWPEWVEEIKGSEYHRILETREVAA